MPISARHSLTEGEFRFCKVYAGFGYSDAPEAYRRAFCVENPIDLKWYFPADADRTFPDVDRPIDGKLAYNRANALLELPHIKGFLDELKQNTGEHARQALGNAVLFGDAGASLKAAGQVLDDEDRLGFRDAVEKWAEILCEIGCEVVVPLPNGAEAVCELRSMFPAYREAMPPADAIRKTIQSLEAYEKKLLEGVPSGNGS